MKIAAKVNELEDEIKFTSCRQTILDCCVQLECYRRCEAWVDNYRNALTKRLAGLHGPEQTGFSTAWRVAVQQTIEECLAVLDRET